MCFATSVLLIGVQSRSLLAKTSKSEPVSANRSNPVSLPIQADVGDVPLSVARPVQSANPEPANSLPTGSSPELESEQILSDSLHPVALTYQPQLVVDLSDRQVALYSNGVLQARYDIAIGREGWETPAGEFQILNMRENPVWQNPISREIVPSSTDNPLGSRWIGFWTDGKHQIGFHGTNQDQLIGQAVSHGCVRMREADIQTLFNQVAIGTPVVVNP
jgi:lipoprotein-anchoring transpeptidase ErfK/SrfK